LLPLGDKSSVPVQVETHQLLVTHLQMQQSKPNGEERFLRRWYCWYQAVWSKAIQNFFM